MIAGVTKKEEPDLLNSPITQDEPNEWEAKKKQDTSGKDNSKGQSVGKIESK